MMGSFIQIKLFCSSASCSKKDFLEIAGWFDQPRKAWESLGIAEDKRRKKKTPEHSLSYLHRAWTMSPEQSQYIWRKTIPHIEVGMGSGVFTSHRSARFGLS